MPKGSVPDRYRDLLESSALGYLATVDPDGRPQVNPVWFLADAAFIYLSVKPDTAKYRNLRANPAALAVGDPARPDRYIEVRGDARSPGRCHRVRIIRNACLGQRARSQIHGSRLYWWGRRRAPLQSDDPD